MNPGGVDRRGPRGAACTPARLAAARALLAVEVGGHAEEALARLTTTADRAQAWFLAQGVLRRRASLDAALRPHLQTPLGGLDPEVRAALRLGAFERLHARTALHAAVSQAVEVARALGAGRATGLVNAVVRRIDGDAPLRRAEQLDVPSWLLARWDARWGGPDAEAWCARNQEHPVTYAVARDRDADPAFVWPGLDVATTDLPGVVALPEGIGAIPSLPGFTDGRWWVQDPASVRVADLVGAGPGDAVLDACAAPGGKAFRLATAGARVTAVDRPGERLGRLGDGARRLRLPLHIEAHDWDTGPLPGGRRFDAVLVDAPCTGLGTLRRHPEIKWRRVEADLAAAAVVQRQVLERAVPSVRPGGVLVYAVCSPEPEEGKGVVDAFLAEHTDFRLDGTLGDGPPNGREDAHWAARMVREGR